MRLEISVFGSDFVLQQPDQFLHLKEINVRSQIISGMMSCMISAMISDRILNKMCYLFLVPILDLPIGIQML